MDPADADEQYLRPGEAAKLLHVSPKTVDRWAVQGRIPCIVTLGGHRRFRIGDVLVVAEQMASTAGGAVAPAAGKERPVKRPKGQKGSARRSRA